MLTSLYDSFPLQTPSTIGLMPFVPENIGSNLLVRLLADAERAAALERSLRQPAPVQIEAPAIKPTPRRVEYGYD